MKYPDANEFNPSAFMRARRPELFSDTVTRSEALLSREVFEYHLETLTKRKQETEFEHFSRKLAEKEICPNLDPQTGPTGGGDSKVDSENYPVADEIALRWYEGIGRQAAEERWAFAFSAKEKWRAKVANDVKKIADSGRDYKLIWFITNQFVKDKDKAEVQDQLTNEHQIPVRILDRGWIVKCVFEHDRVKLAIDALRLTGFEKRDEQTRGPLDTERQNELKLLEEQIGDVDRYRGVEYQLAEDCLQTALLARHLELPRVEIDGRFQRAEQVANKVGNNQQILRVAYNKAWTAYWWYNDFETLNALYDVVEEKAIETDQAEQLELLSNLWTLLVTVIAYEKLDNVTAKIEQRTSALKSKLDSLAADEKRPNNGLYAATLSTLMDLLWPQVWDPRRIENAILSLKTIFQSAQGLGAYPFESFSNVIREFGQYYPESQNYDDLIELVADITMQRTSEAEAGKVLLQRGLQKLTAGKNYEAIRLLGRAQQKLTLEEYRAGNFTALLACGTGYERSGLMWAARASVVGAISLALGEFTARGIVLPQALEGLRRFVWLELQLGRVPQVLMSLQLMSGVAQHLMLEGEEENEYQDERMNLDAALGILFLRTEFWDLKWLEFLPVILERLGLYNSWIALLYALGYEDRLRSETTILAEHDEDGAREFFGQWTFGQPVSDQLPLQPEFLNQNNVEFRSKLLGCEITVETANNLTSVYLAETILGLLEAFFATSIDNGIFPHRPTFKLRIRHADFVGRLPECNFGSENSGTDLEIKHCDKLDYHTREERIAFRTWLMELVAKIMPRLFMFSDLDGYLKVASVDAAFNRALDNADVSIALGNILGEPPKFKLSDWETADTHERFPLLRKRSWKDGLQKEPAPGEPISIYENLGTDEPPEKTQEIKHTDLNVFSLINSDLWERAGWQAVGYIYTPTSDRVPMLALGFTNLEVSKQIFTEWRRNIGRVDEDELLRIAVITGINKKLPFSYNVVIGINPKVYKEPSKARYQQFYLISRVHHMDPPDDRNLSAFLKSYRKFGRYVLLPAHYINNDVPPEPIWDLGIVKRKITVREAWEIGPNDPDAVVFRSDAEPIIPAGVVDAPAERARKKWAD